MTRVLIVDDEPQILRALRINLQARQYEVHLAADGAGALHAAAAVRPDLVILDLGLPDLDGVDVIRRLREDGWIKVATKGSHRQFKHPTKRGKVTVPGKPSDDLPEGTAEHSTPGRPSGVSS